MNSMNFTRDEFIKYLDSASNAELVELAFDAQRDLTDSQYEEYEEAGTNFETWDNASMRKTLVKACLMNRMAR